MRVHNALCSAYQNIETRTDFIRYLLTCTKSIIDHILKCYVEISENKYTISFIFSTELNYELIKIYIKNYRNRYETIFISM